MPLMMSTSHRVNIEEPEPQTGRITFKERVRRHFAKGAPKDERAKWLARAMFVFQAVTQLYTTLRFLIPYIFQDYDPWTQYYLKVFVCFLCVNAVANWLCVLLYDTSYQKTKDRPDYDVSAMYDNNPDTFKPRLGTRDQNGYVPTDSKTEDWSSWRHCATCQMYVPPRAHHCDWCKKCILKRDHHCFLIGNCVGFKNQRYFIVLTFYTSIIGLLGGYFAGRYLHDNFWPHSTFSDFLLPVTFYRFLFGDIDLTTFLLIYHSHVLIPFGIIACLYFSSQILIVSQGITLYEISKKMTVKCTRPMNDNFKSVFGDFWGFNFLFPAQLVFRQREDGRSWDGIKIVRRRSNLLLPK